MKAKRILDADDMIYSTFPEFENEYANIKEAKTLEPKEQRLTIGLGNKKTDETPTTAIRGFVGKRIDLMKVEQELMDACRTSGSSRMYDLFLKGDVRKRAYVFLRNKGFGVEFDGGN